MKTIILCLSAKHTASNERIPPPPLKVSLIINNRKAASLRMPDPIIIARKSVAQRFKPTAELLTMMEAFRQVVNDCIRVGIEKNTNSMKALSKATYAYTGRHDILSYYRLLAISHAAGLLSNRKKSLKRNRDTKDPYMTKPILKTCYGFKVVDGYLRLSIGNKQFMKIPLNNHTKAILSQEGIMIKSFCITPTQLSISYAKEIMQLETKTSIGIDRNLANITIGNAEGTETTIYDVSEVVRIAEKHRSITRTFKRNDVRVRQQLAQKHGKRRANQVKQVLHKASKAIVNYAKAKQAAIVFENIEGIRNLYQKGNYQSKNNRAKMNAWPFFMLKEQITYKAAWEGVSVIQLTKGETRGTSQFCPRCGKRTQVAARDDMQHKRQLWCETCERWQDRDVIAAMNIARKGWLRFDHPQGAASEAMVQESGSKELVILKVDAAKLGQRGMKAPSEPESTAT